MQDEATKDYGSEARSEYAVALPITMQMTENHVSQHSFSATEVALPLIGDFRF